MTIDKVLVIPSRRRWIAPMVFSIIGCSILFSSIWISTHFAPRTIRHAPVVLKLGEYQCKQNGGLMDLRLTVTPERYTLICRDGAVFDRITIHLREAL